MDSRPLREHGPALLVPAAWGVAAGTVAGVVSTHALFVAHLVMSVALVAFAALSWDEMAAGALRAWRTVILAGIPVTLAGVAGLHLENEPLLAVAVYGWILLPAAGFLDTARRVTGGAWLYLAGAGCCVAGFVGLLLADTTTATVASLAVVAVGQTAGIFDAVVRY